MKVKREAVERFTPIVITLETLREAKILLSALIVYKSIIEEEHYPPSDQSIVHDLIRNLMDEGVTEI